ncbi:hypothetical protein TrLO_g7795 [Triparma laevis f. longispina]|uniref:Uncharacterized protein n=1 Tax=Triparma laevis f. longispina TaxID=1714387 RepID=A0A9W6ZK16_9STRA|nr:hypothetical protein TrLO_g7795 [Triparma laevis f. longispina]
MLNNKCDEGVSWAMEKAWGKIEDVKKVEETVNEKVMVVVKAVDEVKKNPTDEAFTRVDKIDDDERSC